MPQTLVKPVQFAVALSKNPRVQWLLGSLFDRYLTEMRALDYHCANIYSGQGDVDTSCYESGLEGNLWKGGVIGCEGISLQLLLRFELAEAGVRNITMRLKAYPLFLEEASKTPAPLTLTMPFGTRANLPDKHPSSYLFALVYHGLTAKCSRYQEGEFCEWMKDGMSSWATAGTA